MNTLIAGLPTLLGTVVGGSATFLTSRWAFNKRDRAETKRQRAALVRDVSTRFLKSVADIQTNSMDKMKAEAAARTESHEAWSEVTQELVRAAQTKQGVDVVVDAMRKGQALMDAQKARGSLTHKLHALADGMSSMGVVNSHIAEMRLILPQKVFKKAELVAAKTFSASIWSEMRSDLPKASGDQVATVKPSFAQVCADRDAAITDFVNALRESFDLDLLTD
jgi:hypothetical protein